MNPTPPPPNRIKEFRERAGLSMAALAEKAGMSSSQVNKLEKGERGLTDVWMRRLATALGCRPADLLLPGVPAPQKTGIVIESPRRLYDAVGNLMEAGELAHAAKVARTLADRLEEMAESS